MKKVVVTLAVILGLGITGGNAQNISYGVKADATFSNFIISDTPNLKSTMDIGVAIGGFVNIPLGDNFALQPELLFHLKDSEFEQTVQNKRYHFEYWGVEIPVYAMGNISLGKGEAYLGIGPYLGFGIDAKYRPLGTVNHNGVYQRDDATDSTPMQQRWDFGAGAMLGYEFKCGIQLNAGYKIGFIDVLDADRDDASMRNQMVSLGAGFRF